MNGQERLEELLLEWEERGDRGKGGSPQELCRECPELVDALAAEIANLKRVAWVKQASPEPPGFVSALNEPEKPPEAAPWDLTARDRPNAEPARQPQRIGRYRVVKVLGE